MISKATTLLLLRLAAVFALVAGVASGLEHLYVTVTMPLAEDQTAFARVPGLIGGVAIMIGMAAIAVGLYAIGFLLEQEPRSGSPVATDDDSREALAQILETLNAVKLELEQVPVNIVSQQATNEPAPAPPPPPPQNVAKSPPAQPAETTAALQRIAARLDEIRDLCLLDDSQRQARLAQGQANRKTALLTAGNDSLKKQAWAHVEKIVAILDQEFPEDPAAREFKEEVIAARQRIENQTAGEVSSRIEDLMAVGSWDKAIELATKFTTDFPENADAKAQLERVRREHEIYVESSVTRLYDEIKSDIDRRRWRQALVGARKLLKEFSGHRKTARIRAQFKTIQENAEIEERQEQEQRLQELIRGKRFAEAIELAEDLIDRYPQSPQAASLEELLPKLRAYAMHHELGPESAAQSENG
jgi:outer membrane protein assembly factor BamD (BamD/ComL family)